MEPTQEQQQTEEQFRMRISGENQRVALEHLKNDVDAANLTNSQKTSLRELILSILYPNPTMGGNRRRRNTRRRNHRNLHSTRRRNLNRNLNRNHNRNRNRRNRPN
jgi:hypothetical protein